MNSKDKDPQKPYAPTVTVTPLIGERPKTEIPAPTKIEGEVVRRNAKLSGKVIEQWLEENSRGKP